MFTCYTEQFSYDFDFTIKADRIRFQEMGFECHVITRPEIK